MKTNWIFIFVLLALLPVILLRDYTPSNELRYLSIADEAIRNGTWVTFTNHGIPYADKPPLYLWIIMASKYLFGQYQMWFLSLFSLVPAFVIVGTMDRWTAAETDRSHRLTWKLLMLSCGLFAGMTVVLRMDMLMCMFITLSLYTFYQMKKREGNQTVHSVLFPLYLFLAVFSKGPIGLLIPLISTVVFLGVTGRIRSVGRYWGWKTWLILLACFSVWFAAVYAEGGWEYLHNLLFHQTLDRAVSSFHHKAPFYYYFLSVGYSLLPWSLLLIGILCTAIYKKWIHTDLQKFFLTIIGVTFLLLSLISSKIAVYLLPAFPFIAYLALIYFQRFKWNRWIALSIGIPAIIFCLSFPALIELAKREDTHYLGQLLFQLAAGILSLTGLLTLYLLYRRKALNHAIRTLACGLFAAIFMGGWGIPRINSELGYGDLCNQALTVADTQKLTDYYVWKLYRPENIDVYLHKEVQTLSPDEPIQTDLHNAVLMLPAEEVAKLPPYFADKPIYRVGRYAILALR